MATPNASEFFIFGFTGETLSNSLKIYLQNNSCGGVILFAKNIICLEQIINLQTALISAQINNQLIISVDQEGGRVARLRGITTDLPPMSKLSSLDSQNLYRIGAMIGRELAVLGFNLNFAPVCDINTNPKNQIISDRSFSSNANLVCLLASQFLLGMQGAGIAACAKHFPGHGDSLHDTHTQETHVAIDSKLLKNRELVPFVGAIKNNVASIMTSHIIYDQIDNNYPATLSKKIIKNILRDNLKFNNLVISDDLDMKAITNNYNLEQIIELGIISSIDLFIIGNNFEKYLEAKNIYQKLIARSPALEKMAQDSYVRIKKFKNHYVGKPSPPSLQQAQKLVRCKPHLDLVPCNQ